MFFCNKDALQPELLCAICHQPWPPEAAKACPHCDALCCETCMSDHLLKADSCPTCNEKVRVDALRTVPRLLRSIAERTVEVRCPNRPSSCWRGPWGQLASHLKECPFDPSKIVHVDEVPDELTCIVCMSVLDSPDTAPCCEQSYCSRCIRASLEKKQECPHCRAALSEALLVEPRASVLNMLKRLRVFCTSKCGWQGERSALNDHLVLCTERVAVAAIPTAAAAGPADVPVGEVKPEPAAAPPAATPAAATPAAAAATPAAAVATPAAATPAAVAPAAALPAARGAVQLVARNYHATVHESDRIEEFYTMAHMTAPPAHNAAGVAQERKALQITAVMDISGSMAGEKMRMAKEALRFVADELKATDRFGVIAFDDKVECTLPLTTMTTEGVRVANKAIDTLRHRGGTNLSSGLFAGIAQVRDMPFRTAHEVRRHEDPAVRVTQPINNVSTASNIMSRLAAFAGRRPTPTATASSVATARPPVADGDDYFSEAPREAENAYCAPFDITIRYNTSACKRDNVWLTRYTFDLVSELPAGASHVSVSHATHGKITLRKATTFGLLPAGITEFTVEVVYDRALNHTMRIPVQVTPDEDGLGTLTLRTEAVGTPTLNRSRIVMLFTDGEANEGITDPKELCSRTAQILAKMPEKDVTIVTFGFGSSHNASLLEMIAGQTQGTYYFVQDTKKMTEIFADCLGGLLSIVASKLRLTIRPALGVKIEQVLTQYPQTPDKDGNVIVTIKDLYAEEQRDVVVKLGVAPRSQHPELPLVKWELEYDAAGCDERVVVVAASLVATVARPFTGAPDPSVDEQINRFLAAEAMSEAQVLADAGRVAEANAKLKAAADRVRCSSSAVTPYCQMLSSDLERAVKSTATRDAWTSEGQKQVSRMKASHAQQRCNDIEEEDEAGGAPSAYVTASKQIYRSKARK